MAEVVVVVMLVVIRMDIEAEVVEVVVALRNYVS